MDDFVKGLLLGGLLMSIVGLLGIWAGVSATTEMNDACAKQHNVYSCHLISVPDEKGE